MDYSSDNSRSGVVESSENSSSTEDGTSTASSDEAKTRAQKIPATQEKLNPITSKESPLKSAHIDYEQA